MMKGAIAVAQENIPAGASIYIDLSTGKARVATNEEISLVKIPPDTVADKEGNIIGSVVKWNPVGFGECIVQYNDGSASSELFSELIFPGGRDEALEFLYSRGP